jgi:signal transduction histidine kinase
MSASDPATDPTYGRLFVQQSLSRVVVATVGFVFIALLGALGGTRPNVRFIVGVLAVQVMLSAAYVTLRPRLPGSDRRWYRISLGIDVAAITLCIHFLSREFVPYGLACYAFLVVYSAASVSFGECVRTAALCVAVYGALLVLRASGAVGVPESAFIVLRPGIEALVTMLFMVAFLATMVLTAGHHASTVRREQLARLAAQADLERLNAELAERAAVLAEKAEELKAFVYTVTHDLKNPLSAILLTADLLLEREGGVISDESREDLRRIVRTADTTEDMIRDLMGLFRITSTPEAPGWVDLDAVAARALDTLRPQADTKGVRFVVHPLPRVWGQADKLGHVLANLFANALQYVPAERGEVEVGAVRENGDVVVHVRDNGVGIPVDYHKGIFELFGRVPDRVQGTNGHKRGTGVGLAIVRRIVEAHRGRVWVESAPGAGSCFYVRLPARDPDSVLSP